MPLHCCVPYFVGFRGGCVLELGAFVVGIFWDVFLLDGGTFLAVVQLWHISACLCSLGVVLVGGVRVVPLV